MSGPNQSGGPGAGDEPFAGSLHHALAEAMRELTPEAPAWPGLFDAVAERACRRTRIRRVLAGTTTLAVAAAVAVAVVLGVGGPAPEVTVVPAAPPPVPCPADNGSVQLGPPYRAGTDRATVPGQPNGATVCFYADDSQPHPSSLRARRAEDATAALALARAVNSGAAVVATPSRTPTRLDCPEDVGGAVAVYFSYDTGPGVWVDAHLSGCQIIYTGNHMVWLTDQARAILTSGAGAAR